MHKKILAILTLLFIPVYFVSADTSSADINTQTPAAQTQTGLTDPNTVPQLLQEIRDAKQLLQQTNLSYSLGAVYKTQKVKGVKKSVLSSYKVNSTGAAVAVLNPANQQTAIIVGTLTGQKFSFNDPNFNINQVGFNGVNTRFSVSQPAGGIVLALKYMITNPTSGSKATIINGMQQVIYVPYSPELNTYAIAQFGDQYLSNALQQATDQLSGIPSAAVPGETVTEAIKPTIIKSLLYAEHMDTGEFLNNPDTQSLINQINILYAVNEGDTFKYAVSSGSARGIAQFVPSTYRALVQRHPEANLIADPITGLEDHVNSIKAEYLLLDDYISDVHVKIAGDFNPAYIYDYAAASYNGGVTRVARAVETFGQNWYTDHSSQTNDLQMQINGENSTISGLKSQIKKAKTVALKKPLQTQLATENAKLAALKDQLASTQSSSLRNETVLYLDKMHRLIQIFNGQTTT